MAEMEDKLNSILSDPGMMQKIMAMAQTLEGGNANKEENNNGNLPEIDIAAVQRITGLAKQTGVDKREQALLRALGGYLSKDRIGRLEKAMRAAKMAKIATSALNMRGFSTYQGR